MQAQMELMPVNVVSTFSGGGGSCLGYKMAGCKILWANEFEAAPAEMYEENFPGTILCRKDIKLVSPQEILEAVGSNIIDILDGSPPCQAFSTAGRRHKQWGKEKEYENGSSQKNEDMFQEYIRLLGGLMPRAFIAENVAQMANGKAKGFLLDVLDSAKALGYRCSARILDASMFGVPQYRSRLYIIGIRNDCGAMPSFPLPQPIVPLNQRLDMRSQLRSITLKGYSGNYQKTFNCDKEPAPALLTSGFACQAVIVAKSGETRGTLTPEEILAISSFPGTYKYRSRRWLLHVCGNSVPPLVAKSIMEHLKKLLAGRNGLCCKQK